MQNFHFKLFDYIYCCLCPWDYAYCVYVLEMLYNDLQLCISSQLCFQWPHRVGNKHMYF